MTLLGPGGIGKSRLSIEVADSVKQGFPGGVVFVALENVLESSLLLPTIAEALGIRDSGEVPLTERLAIGLAGRRMLVILDNFEQIVHAAPVLVQLFTIAPEAVFLVTSRAVLRIRGERVFEVPALATHDRAAPDSVSRARSSPAEQLFAQRAQAVKPDFAVTDANAAAVVAICRALQGLPLGSSWRRPGFECSHPRRSCGGSTGSCPCWWVRRATCPNASGRCARPSSGRRGSWPLRSAGCWWSSPSSRIRSRSRPSRRSDGCAAGTSTRWGRCRPWWIRRWSSARTSRARRRSPCWRRCASSASSSCPRQATRMRRARPTRRCTPTWPAGGVRSSPPPASSRRSPR